MTVRQQEYSVGSLRPPAQRDTMRDSESLIKELQEKLRQAEDDNFDIEERYRHLVEGTHGLICTHDLEGKILSINPSACRALGYECGEVIGRNLRDFVAPSRRQYFHIFLERIDLNSTDQGTMLLEARDGRELVFQYHNIKITKNVDKPYVLGHAYDITELTALQAKLAELAVTDDLTGLNNRRGFLARANERMSLAIRSGEKLKLIFADIDGLKKINDQFGHALGSQAICDVAEILKDSFRQTDVICRLGGDEFVILLHQSVETSSDVVTERVRKKISEFNALSIRPFPLSASFGVVPIDPASGVLLEDIMAEADRSMYEQKRTKLRAQRPGDINSAESDH